MNTDVGRVARLMAVLLAIGSIGCRPDVSNSLSQKETSATAVPQPPVRPPVPASDYVGSQVCIECHREIANSYFQHPMGRSSGGIQDALVVENYDKGIFFDTSDGRRYVVEKHDDLVRHHEQFPDSAGKLVYDQSVEIEWSIGSGRRGRSYAYQRGDRFFQSPIGWYSAKAKWDMSPGYVPEIHQRFDRLLTSRCLNCHVGRVNFGPTPDTCDPQRPIAESVIGCERCHGPAARHVERYRHPETFSGDDPIVNPVKLDAVRRDAVCHQCHLQASNTIARYGRQSHDFRPGDRLSDVWVVLKGATDENKAVTQSRQMLTSECYIGSGGKLGCVSCHDPHSLPQGDPAIHFDARCARCHGTTDGECTISTADRLGQTCIGCHMPRFATSDIPHTALTDHRILRRPDQYRKPSSNRPVTDVFDEGKPLLPEWEIQRARALALRQDRSRVKSSHDIERAIRTLKSLEPQLPDDPEITEMLAWLGSQLKDVAAVERAARRTLELAPGRYESQELLLQALFVRQSWPEAESLCQQLLKQDPAKPLYHSMLADLLLRQNRIEEGIKAAEQSLILNPAQLAVRRRLIDAYLQAGNHQKADEHQLILEALSQRKS